MIARQDNTPPREVGPHINMGVFGLCVDTAASTTCMFLAAPSLLFLVSFRAVCAPEIK